MAVLAPDCDTKLIRSMLPYAAFNPDETEQRMIYLRERQSMVEAGVFKCPSWFQEMLNKLDPKLRCWWDEWKQQWIIDRLQDARTSEQMERAAKFSPDDEARTLLATAAALAESGPYYLTVFTITPGETYAANDEMFPGAPIELNRGFIEWLRAHDMSRYSTAEWTAMQDERAAKIQKANDKKGEEAMLAIVDKMGTRGVEEFCAVGAALKAGDTVTAHGDDLKIVEQMNSARKKAMAEGKQLPADKAINPGHNPLL